MWLCVAGNIRSVDGAREILRSGADKVSINTPALDRPALISELAEAFGVQCVVVGVDSYHDLQSGDYRVWRATGSESTAESTQRKTMEWISELVSWGAGEVVLNCMNRDGVRRGYDLKQLAEARKVTTLPLIASGGAGSFECFAQLFTSVSVDGALAASVFHSKECLIDELKKELIGRGLNIRPVEKVCG